MFHLTEEQKKYILDQYLDENIEIFKDETKYKSIFGKDVIEEIEQILSMADAKYSKILPKEDEEYYNLVIDIASRYQSMVEILNIKLQGIEDDTLNEARKLVLINDFLKVEDMITYELETRLADFMTVYGDSSNIGTDENSFHI